LQGRYCRVSREKHIGCSGILIAEVQVAIAGRELATPPAKKIAAALLGDTRRKREIQKGRAKMLALEGKKPYSPGSQKDTEPLDLVMKIMGKGEKNQQVRKRKETKKPSYGKNPKKPPSKTPLGEKAGVLLEMGTQARDLRSGRRGVSIVHSLSLRKKKKKTSSSVEKLYKKLKDPALCESHKRTKRLVLNKKNSPLRRRRTRTRRTHLNAKRSNPRNRGKRKGSSHNPGLNQLPSRQKKGTFTFSRKATGRKSQPCTPEGNRLKAPKPGEEIALGRGGRAQHRP